jgi:hypothetical protein
MGRGLKRIALAASIALALAAALTIATAPVAAADPPASCAEDFPAYLISIGVDPEDAADALCQEGLRNYAGPACPGKDWNCAPADRPIVQLADPGGRNIFHCTSGDCLVVQFVTAGQNASACQRSEEVNSEAVAVQVCWIVQENTTGANAAGIAQHIQQTRRLTQKARQIARIEQDNATGSNIARIVQGIGQTQKASGGDVEQSQEAHQAATVQQENTTGSNSSHIDQRQTQSQRASGAGTVSQTQNAAEDTGLMCDRPVDDPTFDQLKNQCVEVLQNPDLLSSGPNTSSLNQEISESQTASNSSSVQQSQGRLPPPEVACHCLGQQGDVDQHSSAPSKGEANQETVQTQRATGDLTPGQFKDIGDPRCCHVQTGNAESTVDIVQRTNQMASGPSPIQDAFLLGECITPGSCTIFQSATVNGETTPNDFCTDVSGACTQTITCGSLAEGDCVPFPSDEGDGDGDGGGDGGIG